MDKINIESTLEYTKKLTVLYVEDDLSLQEETSQLLSILFAKVVTANNGEEGLNRYRDEEFDIVITDIKMPVMDGVELTTEIKNINRNQSIIVASAYNDVEYLLDFINLNINHFMQKPLNMDNLLQILSDVSKNILNAALVENYRKELETSNTTLQTKNDELQSLVRILDAKIAQIAKENSESIKGIDFKNSSLTDEHLVELKELEVDISGAAVLISLSKNLSLLNIQVLGEMFLSYSRVISNYQEFGELTEKITTLGQTLNNAPGNFIKRVEDISILLESFIYVLRMWRKNLVENETKKAFELHASMINDISTVIAIIDGTEDEIQSEMEFF